MHGHMYQAEVLPLLAPTFGTPTAQTTTVTVTTYGVHVFQFGVKNGVCDEVTKTVTVTFYDTPTGLTAVGPDVCGLDASLTGGHDALSYGADVVYEWTVVAIPASAATPTFGTPAAKTTTVTATSCGEYEFRFAVKNGECSTVSTTTKVYFYDTPAALTIGHPSEVCGYVTNVTTTFTASCDGVPATPPTQTITPNAGNLGVATAVFNLTNNSWDIDVDKCGEYNFTYTVVNGPCTATNTFTIIFYEEPLFEIKDPELEPTLCKAEDYTVYDLRDCTVGNVTYTWTINPSNAGYFLDNDDFTIVTTAVGNASSTVTIVWEKPGTATLTVEGKSFEGCENDTYIEIDAQYPKIAGQVKYWNEAETFMPSPFPTQDYATYEHDYFYVTLMTYDDINAIEIEIATVKVEPNLDEEYIGTVTPTWNLYEFMSYFAFDLSQEVFIGTVTQTIFDHFGCEGYYLRIWDGGLTYYDMPGGYPTPTPNERILGANYTYNNWGGVNATDALAIQLMAQLTEISAAPYNYNWVGNVAWSPTYGLFSHMAADVNSSLASPFTGNGITAMDALQTNYRSVGILPNFWFGNQSVIQYSPNFRVHGRMVPELTGKITNSYTGVSQLFNGDTWPNPFNPASAPFNGTNVEDIPFFHTQASYLYFSDARNHFYQSFPLPLINDHNINIYYLALGDLNSSHVPTSDGFKAATAEDLLAYTEEMTAIKGDVVTIPVRISRSADVAAITLNMQYNPELIEIVNVNFEQDYYNVDAENGTLRIGWFNMTPAYYMTGDAIALIDVKVIGDINGARFFEIEEGSELADATATPFKDITFETVALKSLAAGEDVVVTNYPNPFRNTTNISYYLPTASNVSLVVYNRMGQVVETLVSGNQAAGAHKVEFGSADLQPGTYYYKIVIENESGAFTDTNTMILIR